MTTLPATPPCGGSSLCAGREPFWIDLLPLTNTAPFALTTDTPGETFVNWLDQHDIPYTGKDTVSLSISGGELLDMARKIYNISDDYTDDQARLDRPGSATARRCPAGMCLPRMFP